MPLVSHIPLNVRAEFRTYWRRRRIVLVVGWGLSVVGWLVIMMIPDRYDAMTRIYVETDNLLTPLLRNITVQADVTKQIDVLQRTLLNRKNMASVAHSTDLDLDLRTDQDKENLYTRLAKQISVKAEREQSFLGDLCEFQSADGKEGCRSHCSPSSSRQILVKTGPIWKAQEISSNPK